MLVEIPKWVGPENCLGRCVKKAMSRKSVKENLSILPSVPERLISLSFLDCKEGGALLHLTWKIQICPLSWCYPDLQDFPVPGVPGNWLHLSRSKTEERKRMCHSWPLISQLVTLW